MVIGNGFFCDTISEAVKEMEARCGCKVTHCVFPTIGNIDYYISERGDLYGAQTIQGRILSRLKKPVRNKSGWGARLSVSPHREKCVPLQVLVYCSHVTRRYQPDVRLTFRNGNPYDCRVENLLERQPCPTPPGWTAAVTERSEVYATSFGRTVYTTAFYCGLSVEDAKDIVSQTYIELCETTWGNPNIRTSDEFAGLWIKMSRLRGIDFWHHYGKRFDRKHYDVLLEVRGTFDRAVEVDLLHVQPGKRRQTYLRMWAEGYTPTEIARYCGCTRATVSSNITRYIQFMRKYLLKDRQV